VLLDEIRTSRIIRPIETIPDKPFSADNDTIALWHLDEGGPAEAFGDASKSANAIILGEPEKKIGHVREQQPLAADGSRPVLIRHFRPQFPRQKHHPQRHRRAPGQKQGSRNPLRHRAPPPRRRLDRRFIKLVDAREGLAGPPSIGGAPLWAHSPSPAGPPPKLSPTPTK